MDREHRWLPYLGERLTTRISAPVAKGAPSTTFPRVWSVYRWLPGIPLVEADQPDVVRLASDVAGFLVALRAVPTPDGAPEPTASNGYRGDPLDRYVREAENAFHVLDPERRSQAREWLHAATRSAWIARPVWVHGDMAGGNLLVDDGRLTAVIDFGCLAVGDPACDLTAAWTIFDGAGRSVFRQAVDLDADTWCRARGWALWKAVITLASAPPGSVKHRSAALAVARLWDDEP